MVHWLVSVVQHLDRPYGCQWDPKVTMNCLEFFRVREL
jgi:hypothetical protein